MFIVQYAKQFTLLTLAIFVVSGVIIATLGLKPSIDFTGGSLTEVSYTVAPSKDAVTETLVMLEMEGYSVRESINDAGREAYIIRTKELTEDGRIELSGAVQALGEGGVVDRFTTIGPVIGAEIRSKAFWAVIAVTLVIVCYVAFAFRGLTKPIGSWVYGGVTILSLIHDVLIPTAVMSLLGYFIGAEIDTLFIMAILAVLGYSVNDTIVVFDRVRENLLEAETKKSQESFSNIVGRSIEQTLLRSFNTSFTTLLALLALYFFGGAVTQNFALVLIAGVIAGTYSSIFMASPFLVLIEQWKSKKAQ